MKDETAEFFDEVGRRGQEPVLRKATGTLRFDLADGKSTERYFVAITKGDLAVSKKSGEADCVVSLERPLFNKIARGETNAMAAVLRGEIGLKGDPELLVLFQRMFPGPSRAVAAREGVAVGRQS
jgi:putative sterol carrier protein